MSQGFFESDDDYRERTAREADERTIEDSTGSAPSKGFFESDGDYRERVSREADERTVEDSTGSAPSKGWFEGDDGYETRVRREANEHTIERDTGSAPKKGWFEGDHDYRSRIAHEARELKARERADSSTDSDSGSSSSYDSGSGSYSGDDSSSSRTGSGAGGVIGFIVLAVLAVVVFAAINSSNTPSSSNSESSRTEQQQPQPTSTGFTVPASTLSPNRRYGVIAPDSEHHKEGIAQNAIVEMATGRSITTIEAETEFVDPNIRGHGGHSQMQPRWSADNSLLLWEVSGKWFPTALVLIKIEDGVARWQIDLLKTAQQEMLARTRKSNPQRYAAAKKANSGNGSAYPEGFTIDVNAGDTPTSSIRLPLPIHARLTSNPKHIDDLPTVEAQLEGTVEANGNVVFRRYHFGPAQ